MKPPSPIDYSTSQEEGMLCVFCFIILTDDIIPCMVMQTFFIEVFSNMHLYFRKPPSNSIMFVSMKQHHFTSKKRD